MEYAQRRWAVRQSGSCEPGLLVADDAMTPAGSQYRQAKLDRSPAPDFHARHKKVRKAMRSAYA